MIPLTRYHQFLQIRTQSKHNPSTAAQSTAVPGSHQQPSLASETESELAALQDRFQTIRRDDDDESFVDAAEGGKASDNEMGTDSSDDDDDDDDHKDGHRGHQRATKQQVSTVTAVEGKISEIREAVEKKDPQKRARKKKENQKKITELFQSSPLASPAGSRASSPER